MIKIMSGEHKQTLIEEEMKKRKNKIVSHNNIKKAENSKENSPNIKIISTK